MEKLRTFFASLLSQIKKKKDSTETTWDTSEFNKKALGLITITGIVVAILLALFTDPIKNESGAVTFSWVKFWLYIVVIYTIASYRFWAPVPTGEQAALTLFGKPLANVGAGAPFAPLGFIQVLTVTAQVMQREFPAEPEMIDRTELVEGYTLLGEKKPPLRIQFRDSVSEADARALFAGDYEATDSQGNKVEFVSNVTDDGLASRVTAEVQHVVRIRVNDPSLFFSNIGDEETTFKQIEDEMVSVLTRFLPRMSAGQALANIKWISIHLHNAVERRVGNQPDHATVGAVGAKPVDATESKSGVQGELKSWGIDVQSAFMKLLNTSHGLNSAIDHAARAAFAKTTAITAAEGERQKRELEGKGAAVAARELEQRTLEGRAKGMQKLAETIDVSGAEVQAAEVARAVADGGNTVVVGAEGFGQLAGIAAATLGKNQKGSKTTTEPSSGDGSANQKTEKGSDS